MDFRLVKMLVLSLNFSEEKQGDEKADSSLNIDAAMTLSADDSRLARMTTDITLNSPGRYSFEAKIAFFFKFNDDVTSEEAEEKLRKAETEKLLFPYIQSYLTNFIMSAGYTRPGIPLVLM